MWESFGPAANWALVSVPALAIVGLLLARRVGFVDPKPGALLLERKRGQTPAAPIGGVLLGALAAYVLLLPGPAAAGGAAGYVLDMAWPFGLILILAAVLLGLVDDAVTDGLSPVPKVLGQFAVSACVVAAYLTAFELPTSDLLDLAPPEGLGFEALFLLLGTVIVMNVINTFDHADGLVLSVGALAFCTAFPLVGLACLALLPFNLRAGSMRLPKLFLGDTGSHLIGALIVVAPEAWGVLIVPALDLSRVVLARLAAGQAFWLGDRRHLGQVLQRAGWSNGAAVLGAAAVMAPSASWAGWGGWAAGWVGVAASAAGYLILLWVARRGLQNDIASLDVN